MADIDTKELVYYFTCYAAPVQAAGTVFGHSFYFRARHDRWSFSLSEHGDIDPVDIQTPEGARLYGFFREEMYGSELFDASWMSTEEAEEIIKRCAAEYAGERKLGTSPPATSDTSAARNLLPEGIIGEIVNFFPVHMGLSGAAVYEIKSTTGFYILRVEGEKRDEFSWEQQMLIMRRAAEHGIAPEILYVDEQAHALLLPRINGLALHNALAPPADHNAIIGSVVAQLRALHALDPDGISERDGVAYARGVWETQRVREGFPGWALEIGSQLDQIAEILARDPRRVVSHNDINPGNVLWDGKRAWLIDWEAAGLMHPYYDMAALTTFLNLDPEAARGLLALQEGAQPGPDAIATFAALRRLVGIAAGCLFLRLVPDLNVLSAPLLSDAPTLGTFYADMRAGETQLQTPAGLAAFGLALLRHGIEEPQGSSDEPSASHE